jgi:hypothetical protein
MAAIAAVSGEGMMVIFAFKFKCRNCGKVYLDSGRGGKEMMRAVLMNRVYGFPVPSHMDIGMAPNMTEVHYCSGYKEQKEQGVADMIGTIQEDLFVEEDNNVNTGQATRACGYEGTIQGDPSYLCR